MEIKYGRNIRVINYMSNILSGVINNSLFLSKIINHIDGLKNKPDEVFQIKEYFLKEDIKINNFTHYNYFNRSDFLIVPVSATYKRIMEKGYFPMGYFVKSISLKTGILYDLNILEKQNQKLQKHSENQEEMFNNTKKQFCLNLKSIKKYDTNITIILIDDMITSGATIAECVNELTVVFKNIIVISFGCSYVFKKYM
jgi:hypothetical protein